MSLIAPIMLLLTFFMPNGDVLQTLIEQPTSDICWESAKLFVLHRVPSEFNAIALGAGCVIHPEAREH